MKKTIALFLTLVLLLSMIACTTNNDDISPSDIQSSDIQSSDTQLSDTQPSDTQPSDTRPNDTHDVIQSYCYVQWTYQIGFIADINGLGSVFIEYDNADSMFKMFDTVIVEYNSSDLIKENGSFGDYEGYTYRVNKPKLVRKADPSKGDLVFG